MKRILITGATGLIGTRLTKFLLAAGYTVTHISRSRPRGNHEVRSFLWDIDRSWIEPGAFKDVDAIVHLAGAGIGDEPWSETRKQEIIDSRVKSSALLRNELSNTPHSVKTFISASGISYYGTSDEKIFSEDDPPASDFLANVTQLWEQEAEKIRTLGIRVVELRTGIVLSDKGGVMDEFVKPIRWYVGAPLGSGKQWMSWIHIDDLCRIYIHAIESTYLTGPFNAVAPRAVTNREFMKATARALHRPILLPPIPKIFLKFLLGEMVYLATDGSHVSSEKIQRSGFHFQFDELSVALRDLFGKPSR
ncbi:MAG TPA: TIGR01777 family oxidoreductase [Cyclobacteriaceae bacterium]|nr:TIGR01777 family oxidoreductase [Cyclobacteriaceae bacterium]